MRWLTGGLLLVAMSAGAQVYEWVDDQGQRHFSDQPPPEGVEYRSRGDADSDLTVYSAQPIVQPERTPPPTPDNDPAPRTSSPSGDLSQESSETQASPELIELQCRHYDARLKQIQEQLRRGYREPRGNQLRAERRRIRTLHYRYCTN